jgi:hydrogenase maturation protease
VVPPVANLSDAAPRIAVIGCGNPNRTDDGAGVEVVRRLRAGPLAAAGADVKVFDAGTDGMAVLFAARGCKTLIVVDACESGAEAGAVFQVPGDVLAAPPRGGFGLHDFRWDHALHAGRQMYGADFPTDVTVFLVEAGSTDFGLGLTAPVARAVDDVAARVAALVAGRATWSVQIRRGVLHFDAALYDRFFGGLATVVLLREDATLLILPVHDAAAGGYLVKQRNRAGARAVDAADFFRTNGLDDAVELERPVVWSAERAALVAEAVFL